MYTKKETLTVIITSILFKIHSSINDEFLPLATSLLVIRRPLGYSKFVVTVNRCLVGWKGILGLVKVALF